MMLGFILYSRAGTTGRSVKVTSALLCATTIFLCTPVMAQNLTAVSTQTGTLVQRIAQSQQRLDAQRLLRANSPGSLSKTYIVEKAQCWLDFSRHEALRNNPSPVPAQAQEKAQALVNALEAGDVPVATDLLDSFLLAMPASQRMRNDLWLRLDTVKANDAMLCSAKAVACGEVMLVQAAHLHQRMDWRYARPYFGMAEDLVAQAQEQAKTCK
jgi:hypothetical protein